MSLITTKQVQTVQIARRVVEQKSEGAFGEAEFRLALRNSGKVQPDSTGRVSCKGLDQAGFENVMALLEDLGYRERDQSPSYWRDRCNGLATSRQVYALNKMAEEGRYPLEAMCRRATDGRARAPEQLTVKQAHRMIEAYKSILAREGKCTGNSATSSSSDTSRTS